MKRIFILVLFVAMIAWCTPGFAAQQAVIADAKLNADGQNEGATINGAWTLTVDGTGGFANIGETLGVSVDNISGFAGTGIVAFSVNSVVSGNMGANIQTLADIQVNAGATTVTFNGTVYSVLMKVNTGTAVFNDGTIDNKAAVAFTGDGTINVAANTKVTGALTTTAGAETGTLNLYGAAAGVDQWTGAVGGAIGLRSINVVGGTNTAGIRSKITGAVDTYGLSLATNTLDITGALTLHGSSIINTTIASASVYGKVVPTGNTTEVNGFSVNVTVPNGTFIPVGTLFNIVDAGVGTSGVPVIVTLAPGTNPLYTFSADPTVNGLVQLEITGNPVVIPVVDPPAVPIVPIAAVVASALTSIQPATADLQVVLDAISALTDAEAVVNAEAQLAPLSPALVAPMVTYWGAREFQNLWSSRLDMCREVSSRQPDKATTCQESDPRSGWWLKGFGYFGDQDDEGAYLGYKSRIIGTMMAYDAPVGFDTRAGLGIGYAESKIDGKTFDTSTDIDTYQAAAYVGHDRGNWFVHGSASFGWNQYSGSRHISFPGIERTADATYSGQDYTAFAKTGYRFSAQKFTLTPLASLQYSRVNIAGYTERDAGDVNLIVESQRYDFIESGLGAKLERDFSYRDWAFVPEIHFEWLHMISNPQLEQIATYDVQGSNSFITPGIKSDTDMYHGGTGFTLLSCACSKTRWSVETGYDYYWKNDGYFAHKGTMRVTARF